MATPPPRQSVVSKKWLVDRFLAGIDLTNDDSDPFPDQMFNHGIRAAWAWMETQLDVVIADRGVDIVERIDWDRTEKIDAHMIFTVNRTPIRSISNLRFVFGGDGTGAPVEIMKIPLRWVRTSDDEAGQIQIVPVGNTAGTSFATIGGYEAWLMAIPGGTIPGYFEITYRAGWYPGFSSRLLTPSGGGLVYTTPAEAWVEGPVTVSVEVPRGARRTYTNAATTATVAGTDKAGAPQTEVVSLEGVGEATTYKTFYGPITVTLASPGDATKWVVSVEAEIPDDILQMIGLYASFNLLNPAGDLVAGSGMQALNISQDGISQGVTTTNSSTNAGFGARIIQYWKDIRQQLPQLRGKYRGGAILAVA